MVQSHPSGSKFICIYLDDDNIGPYGCKHLSKAKWDNLIQLNLGK